MSRVLKSAKGAYAAVRCFGAGWAVYRLGYFFRRKSGVFRRLCPMVYPEFDDVVADTAFRADYRRHRSDVARKLPFPVGVSVGAGRARLTEWDAAGTRSPVPEAEALLTGRLRYYGGVYRDCGFPPRWHHDPISGRDCPEGLHWSRMGDFGFGDIKNYWEPSRFGFAYTLSRAYRRDGDERWPEAFWRCVEDWAEKNPANTGANWKCGQEATLRLAAWVYACSAFAESPATTESRCRLMARLAAAHGARIEANIEYALSQRSNHSLSEAFGLWLCSVVWPEFPESARRRERAEALLLRLADELVYEDGGSCMSSMNYLRFMADVLLQTHAISKSVGSSMTGIVLSRLCALADYFASVVNPVDGEAPVYGSNDGAQILPLASCRFADFRPVAQACALMSGRADVFGTGPWSEQVESLDAGALTRVPPVPTPVTGHHSARVTGHHVLRGDEGFAFVRCGPQRHRPSHADQLHVDICHRGGWLAVDAGTYSYNAPAPLNQGLRQTTLHNTVSVDGEDQMEKVSRFLLYPWAAGTTDGPISLDGGVSVLEGSHDGWLRRGKGVSHRRAVATLPGGRWVILDTLSGGDPRVHRLHWLLADAKVTDFSRSVPGLSLDRPSGVVRIAVRCSVPSASVSLVRADEKTGRGFRSTIYQELEPALSFAVETVKTDSVIFVTVFQPDEMTSDIRFAEGGVSVRWDDRLVEWRPCGGFLQLTVGPGKNSSLNS